MIRIAALHSDEDSSDDNLRSPPIQRRPATKEAQESQAFSLYNKGLTLQRQGDLKGAEQVFRKILQLEVVEEAEPCCNEDEGIVTPIHQLKYSTHKNLAGLAAQNGDNKEAMQNYIQAVTLDSTDVTVWYKMGLLALKLDHYPLARHSFEQGLECNGNHWPCLNQIITVSYALGCYEACLVYISRALQRDPGYMKGLAFLDNILKEQKCLQINTESLFKDCDQEIYSTKLEEDEASEFINEALEMRRRKQKLNKPQPKPIVECPRPMQAYTWKCLGECLVKVYDAVKKAERPVSFACRVDLSSMKPVPQTSGNTAPEVATTETTVPPKDDVFKVVDESQGSDIEMEVEDAEGAKDKTETVTDVVEGNTESLPPKPNDASVVEDVTMETSTMEASAVDISVASETDANTTLDEKKKKAKKKRLPSYLDDLAEKRRSSRVRNVVKKPQEEVVNYQEVLLKILPQTLLHVQEGEDSENSQDAEVVAPQSEQISQAELTEGLPSDSASISETEEADVKWFMERFRVNSGIIELLNEYLIALANRGEKIWPEGVTEVYIKAYRRLRKHIIYPNFLCKDEPDERISDMGLMCLIYCELKLDHWLKTKAKTSPSKRSPSTFGTDVQPEYFEDDMWYIISLSTCTEILDDSWLDFSVRVYWMKARYLVLKDNKQDAADCFERVRELLRQEEDKSIRLYHCNHDSNITTKELEKQIDTLHRCQSLEELQRLYDGKEYDKVVDLLLQTFAAKSKMFQQNTQERHTQLHLLQESLLKLEDYQRCLLWSEVSLNEALTRYQNANRNDVKEEWFSTLKLLFKGLDTCLSKDTAIVKSLPSKNVVRLTQNLIRLIEMAMDASDSASNLAINTVMPWILLYRLMHHEEQKTDLNGSSEDSDKDLRPSLTLLNVTHEYLGRSGWCVSCDGELLLFTANVMTEELRRYANEEDEAHPFKDELTQIVEQCYYCLYGHPSKKTKAKHLQDHGVTQVNLTWERCGPLFDHFKPNNMPEFDSIKTNTVSSELEILLRRIVGLIPNHPSTALSVDSITEYIEGGTNTAPTLPIGIEIDMPIVTEIYYLLADYHFKNKEQVKAIKYYLHDLSMTPERFDSWAGMALAKLSKLEQKLNSHEYRTDGKTEGSLWKNAVAALRCFKRALEMDCTNSKLWIEYGSLAYQLHSFASRQLKQQPMFPLSEDVRKLAMTNKTEMLKIAHNCYVKASECETEESEEEWLHHYMLGKIAEKMSRPPKEYLEHYKQAANHLYEDCAKYPRKITYIYSPPQLACEALEVFYRLHVCALKCIVKRAVEVPLNMVKGYLEESLDTPFAKCKEKKLNSGKENEKKSKVVCADHPYSKRKSKDDSGDRSDQENDSSADEAPASKKIKVDVRMVTNQRTGVPVAGSSASDDSCQSQPAKTPPYSSGACVMSTSTPLASSGKVPATAGPVSTSFSMDNILSDDKFKSPPAEKVNTEEPVTDKSCESDEESGWNTSVEIVDSVISDIVEACEQKKKGISIDIVNDIVVKVVNIVEERRKEQEEALKEVSKDALKDVTVIEISDSDADDQVNKTEMQDEVREKIVDPPKPEKAQPEVMELEEEPTEKNEESDNLANALLLELKQLSGDAASLEISIKSDIDEDFGEKIDDVKEEVVAAVEGETNKGRDEDLVGKVSIKVETNPQEGDEKADDTGKDIAQDVTAREETGAMKLKDDDGKKTEAVSDTEINVKEEKENKGEKNEDKDDASQDLAADALERLTSELMFLNESLYGSTSDSAADNSNVMEWDEAEEKGDKHDVNKEKQVKEEVVDKGYETKAEIEETSPENLVASTTEVKKEHVGTTADQNTAEVQSAGSKTEEKCAAENQINTHFDGKQPRKSDISNDCLQEKSEALSTIGMEYASSVASESEAEDRAHPSSAKESPLPKILETSNNEDLKEKELTETEKQKRDERSAENKPAAIENNKDKEAKVDDDVMVLDAETGELLEKKEDEKATNKSDNDLTVAKEEEVASNFEDKDAQSSEKKSEEQKEKKEEAATEERSSTIEVKEKEVLDLCLKGLELCLKRFPQHFKSLYRMAFIYYHSKDHRNLQHCRDLLMGNPGWQQLDHMPCPGLFQERKANNFFQGLWRIPIEEFDRAGSFPWHLMRSLLLLFDVLRELKDSKTFFFIYQQLNKSPDAGKKYLRDTDRQELAKLAWRYTLDSVEANLPDIHKQNDTEKRMEFLMTVHKIWNYGKVAFKPQAVNGMLSRAYRAFRQGKIDPDPSPFEQAIRFCQQHLAVKSTAGGSSPAVSLQKPSFPGSAVTGAGSPATLQKEESLKLGDPSKYTSDVQSKLPRLQSDVAEKLSFQPIGQSSPKKPKVLSPSRAAVEKTNLGQRELNELLERELSRKKDLSKKVKSPGRVERKTMKQLKALANPVLGVTAVETALKPTVSISSPGKVQVKVPQKPKDTASDKPTEKPVTKPAAVEKPKERVDSPALETAGEEALVQESMIQAMLHEHAGTQANMAAAMASSSRTGLEGYNPYASMGMHPMWSMYSPTFVGNTMSGLPMMDPSTAAALGYLPGMASATTKSSGTKPAATTSKKQSTSTQLKKSFQQSSQLQVKKAPITGANVKKSSGVKRPFSPTISLPSVVIPKLSLDDIPSAKKLATEAKVLNPQSKKFVTGQKAQSGVRPVKKSAAVGSQGVPRQQFNLNKYEKATLPSGLTYLKPISPPRAAPKPAPKGTNTVGKPRVTATQPRKVTVYPVEMTSAYSRKQPPPAHGGASAARKPSTSGLTGLDFSRTATVQKPRPPPRPPSDDDDVIILDDSD